MQVKSSSRSNHERMFLKEIKENGPITRAQLAQRLGMAKPTSSSIATQMISRKLVREIGMEKPQFGRPGKLLEINPNGGCAVGLGPECRLPFNCSYGFFRENDMAENNSFKSGRSHGKNSGFCGRFD